MQTADVLDAMGGLVAQVKMYAAKLPPIVHLSAVPTGVKPKCEAVEEYEVIVSRFRSQSARTPYKCLNELFVESLEAFEVGRKGCGRKITSGLIWNGCSEIKKSKSDGAMRSVQASIDPL